MQNTSSIFCYPEWSQDILDSKKSLRSLGCPRELCAEIPAGTEWVDPASSCIRPLLNKPSMLCDVKMRKTQGSPQKQQLSKAGDKNEFRTFFFFPSPIQKKNQKFIFTQLSAQELHSARGKNMQSPYTLMKTYLHFLLKRQPVSEREKYVFKKINEWYF